MIADPTQPVSWNNPDITYTVLVGRTRRELLPAGIFETRADAVTVAAACRVRYPIVVIQKGETVVPEVA